MKETITMNYCIYVTEIENGKEVETRYKLNSLYTLEDARAVAYSFKSMESVIAVRIEKRVKVVETLKEVVEVVL